MRLRVARWRLGLSIALAVKAIRYLGGLEQFAVALISAWDELNEAINEQQKINWNNNDVRQRTSPDEGTANADE